METDLHSKSRNELREALRRKGLSPSGVKEDLIKRLEGFGGSIQSNSFISSGLNSNAFVLSTRKQMDANESHRSTDDEQPSPQPHHLQSTQQSIQQQQQQQQQQPANNVLQTQQLLVAEQSAINHQEQLINASRAILSDESPICGHPNKYGKPCQRVGRYCPYHGVIKGALERQQHQNEYSSNNAATSRFKEFTKHVVEADPTYIPASVSALPTTIEYSHTSASVIGKRKVDNYSTIVDTLINRPTKRFKHVDLSAEDIARQRFFQHAALEFERIREDQQHQLELQQLQHQIEAMREKAQQKDKVIESLERTISEMDRNLLSNPDKVSSDDISRWKLSTQKIYDDQLKNIF